MLKNVQISSRKCQRIISKLWVFSCKCLTFISEMSVCFLENFGDLLENVVFSCKFMSFWSFSVFSRNFFWKPQTFWCFSHISATFQVQTFSYFLENVWDESEIVFWSNFPPSWFPPTLCGISLSVPSALRAVASASCDSPGTCSVSASRRPNWSAQWTQSSMLTFWTGMKGQTSSAPVRGCSPAAEAFRSQRFGSGERLWTRTDLNVCSCRWGRRPGGRRSAPPAPRPPGGPRRCRRSGWWRLPGRRPAGCSRPSQRWRRRRHRSPEQRKRSSWTQTDLSLLTGPGQRSLRLEDYNPVSKLNVLSCYMLTVILLAYKIITLKI